MSSEAGEKFPKSARLRKRPEFLALSRSGRKVHSPHFLIVSGANQCGATRLGITVSGKVGNAVVRNRIKRSVREFFRRRRGALSRGIDYLVIARKSAADLSSRRITEELNYRLLERRGQRK